MVAEVPWVAEARKHIGVKEIPGVNHHPLILSMWKAIKRAGIKTDEVPWCAAFVGFCLENVGIQSSRYESAKSYEEWGMGMTRAFYGAIVVFRREGGGHVGFVVGRDKMNRLMVLGGNQGNEVRISPFDLNRIVAYRWPTNVPFPPIEPLPVLESDAPTSTNEA